MLQVLKKLFKIFLLIFLMSRSNSNFQLSVSHQILKTDCSCTCLQYLINKQFNLVLFDRLGIEYYERCDQNLFIKERSMPYFCICGEELDNFKLKNFNFYKKRIKKAAISNSERLWKSGIIPYVIDNEKFDDEQLAIINKAMKHWEEFTCIKFVEKLNEHQDFIILTENECGCCSIVGRKGNGSQFISLTKECSKFGIIVHELGHSIGFWHEHARPDRDQNVEIISKNILLGRENNFVKLSSKEINSLNLPYDFQSIMHYARNTFAKKKVLSTIEPKIRSRNFSNLNIGQRIRISEGDIKQTNLLYKCPICGRNLLDLKGSFTLPQFYNFKNQNELICEWRISGVFGDLIFFNMTLPLTNQSTNCELNYIELKESYHSKSFSIKKLCFNESHTKNIKLIFENHHLIIKSIILPSIKNINFTASYEIKCGGLIDKENGLIQSPNYPDKYLPNKKCIWLIKIKKNYELNLKFIKFNLEEKFNCEFDYLEISQIKDENKKLIGRYCGNILPPIIKSKSDYLQLRFITDSFIQKTGFNISYTQNYDYCTPKNHNCSQICVTLFNSYKCKCRIGYELNKDGKTCVPDCGGYLHDKNGIITSPNWPNLYPSNKQCIWELIAPPGLVVILNFTFFDLEFSLDCEGDQIKITSKLSSNEFIHHGYFCGFILPPLITSINNSLILKFDSNSVIQKKGFFANYFFDLNECLLNNGGCEQECLNTIGSFKCLCKNNFVLSSDQYSCLPKNFTYYIQNKQGFISMPNHHTLNSEYVWIIEIKFGSFIKLSFDIEKFNITKHFLNQYLIIYDFNSLGEKTQNYLNEITSNYILSSNNNLIIKYISNDQYDFKGIIANFSTFCGGRFEASNKYQFLYSHATHGKEKYNSLSNCNWLIQCKYHDYVRLRFETFDLEQSKNCESDYLQIFDSNNDDEAFLIGSYCGNNIPIEITSSGNSLFIRFRTDNSTNCNGFSLIYFELDIFNDEKSIL